MWNIYCSFFLFVPIICTSNGFTVQHGSMNSRMTRLHVSTSSSAKGDNDMVLNDIVRLRGPVDQGYGRGGKKLGFPTANLPSSLFADAISDVQTGVYIGWAVIESSMGVDQGDESKKRGRDVIHKAVVNVGYSPTFDGEENKEKIVEAHLIVDEDDIEGDFYGETMRLGLYGFLRPEMKFPSFPDLIEAITNDVTNAKSSLDRHPFSTFGELDLFVSAKNDEGETWVGSSGGDGNASYEFEKSAQFLTKEE